MVNSERRAFVKQCVAGIAFLAFPFKISHLQKAVYPMNLNLVYLLYPMHLMH